jgi:hypothetical protein
MECYCYLNVDLLSVQHLLAILFWQLFGVQIGTDMSVMSHQFVMSGRSISLIAKLGSVLYGLAG